MPTFKRSIALVAAFSLFWCCSCTRLFFYPEQKLFRTPDTLGLSYQDVVLQTSDGVALHGWRLLPESTPWARVVFFHGNAENISTHIFSVFWLPAQGIEVLLFDYRGYGRSAGAPTIAGVHRDAQAILSAAFAGGLPSSDCQIVFGQSLGASVAAVAAESFGTSTLDAVVLDSGFADYRSVAEDKLSAVWLTRWAKSFFSWWFSTDYSPREAVAALTPVPVLLLHGAEDTVVLPRHSKTLFDAAGEPKSIWLVEGVGHTQAITRAQVRARLLDYFSEVCREKRSDFIEISK